MSFELFNAFVTFQILINKILINLMNYICVIYFDDIFIYDQTSKKHWRHVREIFNKLRKYFLYVKLTKCKFMIIFVEFLKYIINNHDISINSNKIQTIVSWSEFDNLKKLQMFLSFVNFYRKFVVQYAKIIKFLFNLLKNNKNEK